MNYFALTLLNYFVCMTTNSVADSSHKDAHVTEFLLTHSELFKGILLNWGGKFIWVEHDKLSWNHLLVQIVTLYPQILYVLFELKDRSVLGFKLGPWDNSCPSRRYRWPTSLHIHYTSFYLDVVLRFLGINIGIQSLLFHLYFFIIRWIVMIR